MTLFTLKVNTRFLTRFIEILNEFKKPFKTVKLIFQNHQPFDYFEGNNKHFLIFKFKKFDSNGNNIDNSMYTEFITLVHKKIPRLTRQDSTQQKYLYFQAGTFVFSMPLYEDPNDDSFNPHISVLRFDHDGIKFNKGLATGFVNRLKIKTSIPKIVEFTNDIIDWSVSPHTSEFNPKT